MATYKIIGQRYLRKYTEPEKSPVYAAAIEAQQIVDSLCTVPWKKVGVKDARMTYHTEEQIDGVSGLDKNVDIRDSFDAALFCAGHSSGQHRAYANAAVYRYTLPDGAVGVSLTSLTAKVTSDPYNSNGARIHIFTNSTGEIPMNCHDLRGEDSEGDLIEDGTTESGVAPRTSETVSGKEYWYPTTSTCTLSPTGGMVLQKYLFIALLMESYSTVRGNWIEGCSFISNNVSITTSAALTTLDASAVNDLRDSAGSGYVIASGGILPYVKSGFLIGERHVEIRADANPVIEDDGSQTPARSAGGTSAASALSRLYREFYEGNDVAPIADGPTIITGAAFNVTRETRDIVSAEYDIPVATDIIRIDMAAIAIPFVYPVNTDFSSFRIAFGNMTMSNGAYFNVLLSDEYMTSIPESILKNKNIYTGESSLLRKLGTITGTGPVFFDIGSIKSTVGTIVIAGFIPPEEVDVSALSTEGTGITALMPNISII